MLKLKKEIISLPLLCESGEKKEGSNLSSPKAISLSQDSEG